MAAMNCRVVFLDRDGTLNVDRGYVYRIADWEFIPGAIDALRIFRQDGFRIALVTNQSGIARGYYSLEDMHALHEHVCDLLGQAGLRLDAIAYCPHGDHPTCDCRKPLTGMAHHIEQALGDTIDYARSWTIGDKLSDLYFGLDLGTHTALIRSRYWTDRELTIQPDLIVESLHEAASRIVPPCD